MPRLPSRAAESTLSPVVAASAAETRTPAPEAAQSLLALWAEAPAKQPSIYLYGSLLTPKAFLAEGTVVLVGDRIAKVSPGRLPPVEGAFTVDTKGLLCPGFVDSHNHAAFNVFPRWEPRPKLENRWHWRGSMICGEVWPDPDPFYRANVWPLYAYLTKTLPPDRGFWCMMTRYGQARGLIGGATTMMIDAMSLPPVSGGGAEKPDEKAAMLRCLEGFVREPRRDPSQPGDLPGNVWGILDVLCLKPEEQRALLAGFEAGEIAALLVHLGEGRDTLSRGELHCLRSKGLLRRETAVMHGLALSPEDWDAVRTAGSRLVWSPASNLRLYGTTVDIGAVLAKGVRVALAPDWTVTGSSNLLLELAAARPLGPLTPRRLVEMVTTEAAAAMGHPKDLGRLEPEAFADVLVFAGRPGSLDEACELVASGDVSSLELAVVGGLAVYGTEAMMREFGFQSGRVEEAIEVPWRGASLQRRLRLARDGEPTLADIRREIVSAARAKPEPDPSPDFDIAPLVEP